MVVGAAMTLTKYWANRHSIVGEHDSLRGNNSATMKCQTITDIPIYLACDVDARIAVLEQDQRARIEALHTLRMGYDATVAQLEAQVATAKAEIARLKADNVRVGQIILDAFPFAPITQDDVTWAQDALAKEAQP